MDISENIYDFGKTISHIEFKLYPDVAFIEALLEENEHISFSFPTQGNGNKHLRGMGPTDYSSSIASRIISAEIETDCFIDNHEFHIFENLQHMVLSISNTDVEYYDDADISNLWHVLTDLAGKNLKTVIVDISQVTETAATQIKTLFKNPHEVVELRFIESIKRKRIR